MKIFRDIIINIRLSCQLPRSVRSYSDWNRVVKSDDNFLLNKELMRIEWKILIIKILIIFFLYIISLFSLDIIMVIFSYTYIIGDLIMCAEMPGSEEPLNTEHANIYTPNSKEDMKDDVKIVGEMGLDAANLLIGGATLKTFTDAITGDIPEASVSALTALGGIAVKGLIRMGVNEVCRKIEEIPDDHPTDEPISPGYGSDSLNSIDIPFLKDLLDIIEGLDDETKLICYILILIFIVLYIQLFKLYKNYINKNLNDLANNNNNKYLIMFIKYKNYMNKYTNLYLNLIIGFFFFISLLGVLMLIFLF